MRLTVYLLLLFCLHVSATGTAQLVTLKLKNAQLRAVFKSIKRQTNYTFFFNPSLLENNNAVTLDLNEVPLMTALDSCFGNQPFTYSIEGRIITITPLPSLNTLNAAQHALALAIPPPVDVRGQIMTEDGEPLAGVTVTIKGSNVATTSDAGGKFSINTPENAVLIFSHAGFVSQELPVKDQTSLRVVLKKFTEDLGDVVVVGYGKSSVRNITGSITTVKSEDFNQGVISSPVQLLQGKVPGLNITRSGDPNARPTVILRGPSTLRSGEAQEPLYVIDGIPGLDINLLSPDDIQSIDVLKDASSTAIYGSRAANGVIMITTRRARSGQTKVSYNGYAAMEKVSNRIEMLTGDELRAYLAKNDRSLGVTDNDEGVNTDWQKEVQRTGLSHNHNIGLSGSNENTSYNVSVNYLDNKGIMKTSSLDRTIIRAGLEQKAFGERLKLGLNVVNSLSNQNNPPSLIYLNMLNFMPSVSIHRPDGTYTENFLRSGTYRNPTSLIENNIDYTRSKIMLMNAKAEVKILPGLVYTLSLASQIKESNRNIYYNHLSGIALNTNGKAIRNNYEDRKKIVESYFNYDRSFGNHNFQLLAGYSWQEDRNGDGFQNSNQGFVTDDLTYNNLALGDPPSGYVPDYGSVKIRTQRIISYYGRVNYQYADKYLLQASLRNDGSSVFGVNQKWGYFPAFSAGWRISSEPFMKSVHFINDLKLRAGYGSSGNALGFDALIAQLIYNTTGRFYYNGRLINGVGPYQNANPDLKWERTGTTNIGLDFSLFNNRISGGVDYYDKRTSDLIWTYNVSTTQYFVSVLTANAGEISNKGIELTLTAVPVKTKNFTWKTTLLASHNKNVVESLSNDKFALQSIPTGYVGGKGQSGNLQQLIAVGQPIGTFYMWKYMGKNEDGVTQILKKDGTLTTAPTTEDYVFLGNAQPKLLYGWNNTFLYRNFDLNVFFRGVKGNKILNGTLAALNSPGDALMYNIPRFTVDESVNDNNAHLLSDRFIEDGSYLRLENVELGYTFKAKIKYVSHLRFYASANNVFIITKYRGIDPEVNIGGIEPGIDNNNYYPKTRSVIVGVNIIF